MLIKAASFAKKTSAATLSYKELSRQEAYGEAIDDKCIAENMIDCLRVLSQELRLKYA